MSMATPCKTAGTRISEVSSLPCKAFCCFRHISHKKGALKTKVFYSISAVGKRSISLSYHQIYGGFMKRIILGFMLLALSGCGSGGGKTAGVPDGTALGALNSSAAKSTPLAAGDTDCPTGGILFKPALIRTATVRSMLPRSHHHRKCATAQRARPVQREPPALLEQSAPRVLQGLPA